MVFRRHWKIFLVCFILLACLLCWHFTASSPKPSVSPVAAVVPDACDPGDKVVSSGIDTVEYIPECEGEIVRHTHYVLSFNNEHKQANWVYYGLELEGKECIAERSNDFRVDKSVSTGSAVPSDYAKSGYDRGHLCPAADMAISAWAMSETFYMSNMSPQAPSFNRGIWKSLEEQVRSWGKKEKIFIVVGPVFKDGKGAIGRNRVTVPGYYYKVVYSPDRKQMIAFVLPNEKGKKTLKEFIVSVDSVESLTDIDFFPQLPDFLQSNLECRSDSSAWKWR